MERSENILHERAKSIVRPGTLTEQLLYDSKTSSALDKLPFANKKEKALLMELAIARRTWWGSGKYLWVRFLESKPYIQSKVQEYAKIWEQFTNIHFNFVTKGDAEIRISFTPGGTWSQVGTNALSINDQTKPTMNFGWFHNQTVEDDFSSTILHEFGHALGCIHEHQTSDAVINWSKPELYKYCKATQDPPWDEAMVDFNIFRKYSQAEITNNVFDARSIMLYPIPPGHTTDGINCG
jgi:hypothetical protein